MRKALVCLVLSGLLLLGGCNPRRALPAPPGGPEATRRTAVFHNTLYGWSIQLPAGWRPAATAGAADPATSPSVTFVPPEPDRSQDEYLAVRLCHSLAHCLPPEAQRTDGAPAAAGAYALQRQATVGPRRVREVHTLFRNGQQLFDVVLSRPEGSGKEAEAIYPAFRDSFRMS